MRIEQLGDGKPELAVVGGIHGDEPAGAAAVDHLVETAPAVERPVKLVVANEAALDAGARYVDRDLNRSFPGDADGATHEERLADALAGELADCVTLSLHSTRSYEEMFALVDEVDDLTRRICPHLPIEAVVEIDAAEGRIFAALPDTIEVECGYQGSAQAIENAKRVSREFLAVSGALPNEGSAGQSDLPVFRLGESVPKSAADEYEVYADNFEEVLAGEAFAAADGEAVVAEEAFHPVLMSAYGYEDLFGFTARRTGALGPERSISRGDDTPRPP